MTMKYQFHGLLDRDDPRSRMFRCSSRSYWFFIKLANKNVSKTTFLWYCNSNQKVFVTLFGCFCFGKFPNDETTLDMSKYICILAALVIYKRSWWQPLKWRLLCKIFKLVFSSLVVIFCSYWAWVNRFSLVKPSKVCVRSWCLLLSLLCLIVSSCSQKYRFHTNIRCVFPKGDTSWL